MVWEPLSLRKKYWMNVVIPIREPMIFWGKFGIPHVLSFIWYFIFTEIINRIMMMSDDVKVLMIFTAVKAQAFSLLGRLETLGSGVTAAAWRRQFALQQEGPMPLVWSRAGVWSGEATSNWTRKLAVRYSTRQLSLLGQPSTCYIIWPLKVANPVFFLHKKINVSSGKKGISIREILNCSESVST